MDKVQRTIETERVVNIVRGFGWELVSTNVEGEMIQVVIKKTVTPIAPAA